MVAVREAACIVWPPAGPPPIGTNWQVRDRLINEELKKTGRTASPATIRRAIKDPRRKRRGIAVCRCSSMGLTPQAAGNVTQRDSNATLGYTLKKPGQGWFGKCWFTPEWSSSGCALSLERDCRSRSY